MDPSTNQEAFFLSGKGESFIAENEEQEVSNLTKTRIMS